MFFGGFSGATAFYPDRIMETSFVPRTVLTDFRLFGSQVPIGSGSPLDKSITYTDAITLSHVQNIFSIEFSALSYFNAATNRYRYKLDGVDNQWREVNSDQRVASYTTLPAGTYTFHVQGATSRGAWNEPGASIRIRILPPWWSSPWFRTLYGSLIMVSLWSAYRYRLHQMARQFNIRLEERLGERTRIAGELHDTLLQGVLSASMQLHVAIDQLPQESAARPALRRVLQLIQQVVEEGRNAVNGLRSASSAPLDLEQAFSNVKQEVGLQENSDFRVTVKGVTRPLHPLVRDEIYGVGREALTNAFRHSKASDVEVALEYGSDHLRVLIRDNGIGIDPHILQTGRAGHWGLRGMRERASKIGAEFRVLSRAAVGTEIELSVPSHVAYTSRSSRYIPKLLGTLFSGRKQTIAESRAERDR